MDKGLYSQSCGFSSSHVQMWELGHKEGLALKINAFTLWWWRRLLRVPWTARRSSQSILKEINPGNSLEGLMLKLQYFGHMMWRGQLIGKDPDAGKDERQKEKTEDEMIRYNHQLNGYEFEQTPGDSGGQRSLMCYNPRGQSWAQHSNLTATTYAYMYIHTHVHLTVYHCV